LADTSNLAGDVDANGDVVDELREALREAIKTSREAVAARDRGELNDAAVGLAFEVADDLLEQLVDELRPPLVVELRHRFAAWFE
jgi:hypothetical protein